MPGSLPIAPQQVLPVPFRIAAPQEETSRQHQRPKTWSPPSSNRPGRASHAFLSQMSLLPCADWLAAAESFEMNTDFDLSGASNLGGMDFSTLLKAMKEESAGKRTIMALADKLVLSQLLDNLGVPQMPCFFKTRSSGEALGAEVRELVARLEALDPPREDVAAVQGGGGDGDQPADLDPNITWEMAIKPVHLSDATGVLLMTKEKWVERGFTAEKLAEHMDKYMLERARQNESAALRSLTPGVIVQPRYRSAVDFKCPLELRVTTIWGRARVGIWWWGRIGLPRTEAPQRTVWMVRRPQTPGTLSDDDFWEPLHEHPGGNEGFDEAVRLFKKHMPAMAAMAELIATSVGAPFLRSDFFVGDERWHIRLNEVAYGSGVDYRNSLEGVRRLQDDGPTLAYILQEGQRLCKRRAPETFLAPLGARGNTYPELVVEPLPTEERLELPATCIPDPPDDIVTMPNERCQTPRRNRAGAPHTVQRVQSSWLPSAPLVYPAAPVRQYSSAVAMRVPSRIASAAPQPIPPAVPLAPLAASHLSPPPSYVKVSDPVRISPASARRTTMPGDTAAKLAAVVAAAKPTPLGPAALAGTKASPVSHSPTSPAALVASAAAAAAVPASAATVPAALGTNAGSLPAVSPVTAITPGSFIPGGVRSAGVPSQVCAYPNSTRVAGYPLYPRQPAATASFPISVLA